ncbi:Uncharacterised protein [Shigella sonnei]|nr:Uncharacterised protein [Shigella sonnei]
MSDFGITVDTVGGSCQCLPLRSLPGRRLHNLTSNQLPQIACETFNFRASVDGVETKTKAPCII